MASARHRMFSAPPPSDARLHDDFRFHALLPDADWGRLPVAIWRRFSKRLADCATIVYVGEIDEAHLSRAGWWFAQVARLIGGPLPTSDITGVPMIVAVTEDAASGGQIGTRMAGRRHGFRRWSTRPSASPVRPACGSISASATFTAELARGLHRPALLRVPDALLRRFGGDFANELLLGGQRVLPNKALGNGFVFRHQSLRSALEAIL
jgi:uncharacterized protein DUF1731/uncharacterized protein DUF4166